MFLVACARFGLRGIRVWVFGVYKFLIVSSISLRFVIIMMIVFF